MAGRLPPGTTVQGGAQWLLVLTLGGRELYLTDGDPVRVVARATGGTSRFFSQALSPIQVDRTLDLFSASPSPRSMGVECHLDADLALQVAWGHALFAARAELSQWYPGTDWEDRRVYLRGVVDEPLIGEAGEVATFTVLEVPFEDGALVPPATAVVSASTQPTANAVAGAGRDSAIEGAVYPIVIGQPGSGLVERMAGSVYGTETPGSPALLTERGSAIVSSANKILIAWGQVAAETVKVFNLTDPSKTEDSVPVRQAVDKLGQPFAYVYPNAVANLAAEGDELWVAWNDGGGLRNPFGRGALRGAGDVIRWALSQSTLRVDTASLASLRVLNSYLIDGFLNSPISPWQWLSSEVLPLLPVAVSYGLDGLLIRPIFLDLPADQTAATFREGHNATRYTGLSFSGRDGVVNKITLRYAPNGSTGTFAKYRTLTADTDPDTASASVYPSPWAKLSQAVFGVRAMELQSSFLYDDATAEAVIGQLLRRSALPQQRVAYLVGPEFDFLRPGDSVRVIDEGLHWKEAVGHVVSVSAGGGDQLVVGLTRFPPLRHGG